MFGFQQTILKKSLVGFLILGIFLLPLNFQGTNKVFAAPPVSIISDESLTSITTSLESGISALEEGAQTFLMGSLNIKEFTLDAIAYGIGKLILKNITRSILNWINSGFQGSPAFVTDLEGFLLDIADQTAGDFIHGTQLGFLCSPFELDIRIALALQYQTKTRDYQPKCTLSNVVDNIDNFLNSGDFSEGGWQGWFELTQNPQNTPTGSYLAAETEMGISIRTAEGRKIDLLKGNDFFLNFEICDAVNSVTGSKKNCTTATPGKIISEQLTFQLQSGPLVLIEADEINEIVGALFAQLGQQALTGAAGLLGLGGSSYSSHSFGSQGNSSYLDAISEEDQQILKERIEGDRGVIEQIAIDIEVTEDFIDVQDEIIIRVDSAKLKLDKAIADHTVTDPDTGITSVECFNLPFSKLLTKFKADAQVEIPRSNTQVALLEDLALRFKSASTTDAQLAAAEEYSNLRRDSSIISASDLVRAEFFVDFDLKNEITDFTAAIAAETQRCDSSDAA